MKYIRYYDPEMKKIFIRQKKCFLALYKSLRMSYYNLTAYPIDPLGSGSYLYPTFSLKP